MTETNKCGTCRACCRALGVKEIDKPEWRMCSHAMKGGCGIYATRPLSCKTYECIWLTSQSTNTPMPPTLRPDRCGVVLDALTDNPKEVVVVRVPAGQMHLVHKHLVSSVIGLMVDAGNTVIIRCGDKTSSPVRVKKLP